MILCHCNFISSNTIKQIVETHYMNDIPSVQEIMEKHGCSVECATCVRSIKEEIRKHYDNNRKD
jgi:bacterioferritin-associated ferredoxin